MNQQQFDRVIERLMNKFNPNIVHFLERHPALLMKYLKHQFEEMEYKEEKLQGIIDKMNQIIEEIRSLK